MSASSVKPLNVQLPAITLILFALCVGIFCYFAQWMSYEEVDQSALIHLGANVASLTLSGESWRLLSSVFLHSSVSHLLMNMFALLVVGGVVELANEGMTMMVVTHEMGFARKVANRVIFMDEGKIVEDSPKDAFFDDPKSDRAKDFLAKILH